MWFRNLESKIGYAPEGTGLAIEISLWGDQMLSPKTRKKFATANADQKYEN